MQDEKRLRTFARANRKRLTNAEALLWSRISNSQVGGHEFSRQIVIGPHIIDFACRRLKLVVELDGDGRDAYLRSQGYTVVRIPNTDLFANLDGVLERLLNILDALAGAAPPTPVPPSREGRREKEGRAASPLSFPLPAEEE